MATNKEEAVQKADDLIQLLRRKDEQKVEGKTQSTLRGVLRCLHYRANPEAAVCPHNCPTAQANACRKVQAFLWDLYKEVREELANDAKEKVEATKKSKPVTSNPSRSS